MRCGRSSSLGHIQVEVKSGEREMGPRRAAPKVHIPAVAQMLRRGTPARFTHSILKSLLPETASYLNQVASFVKLQKFEIFDDWF